MELTIEIARRTETGEPELLAREDVAAEGLDSPEQLERPLFLDIHVRMRAEEPQLAEAESPLVQVQREPRAQPATAAVIEPEQPSESEAEDLLIEESQEGIAEEEPEPAGEAEAAAAAEPEPVAAGGAAAQVAAAPSRRMDSASDSPVIEVVEEATQPAPEAEAEGAVTAEPEPAPGAAAEAEPLLLEVSEVEVAPPSAETADEFAQQLAAAAESVPQPVVSVNDAALRRAAGGGAASMRRQRGGLRPEQLLDPRPVPPEPPAATAENPVPRALWIIDRASQSRLTDQTPPPLTPTPRGNTPRLGDRERSEGEMQAITEFGRSYQELADQAQQSQCSFELELGMSLAPLSPEEEEIRELYSRMRQVPTQSIQPEPPQAIVTRPEPPIVPPLRQAQPTDVARVYSYLLAQPEQTARDALIDIRRGMAPANAVGIEFPKLGGNRVTALAGELDRDFRDMAQQAGASAAQLDQAVEARRRELEQEALRRLKETEQSFADASQMVCEEAAVTTAMVDAGASAMTEHADEVCAAAQEVDPDTEILATQDRLLTQARERSAGYNAHYRRMGERRESMLNSTERAYISAYTYAKQRDEVQIYDDPSLTDEQREHEITALRAWLTRITGAVGPTFTDFRGSATIQISRFNSELEQATCEAFAEIRDWAAARMGVSRDFEQQLQDEAADWDVQVQANADAWRAVENGRQAAEANRYIEFYAGLRDAAKDETRQQAVLGNQQLNSNQRMIAAAYFGRSTDPDTGLATDPVNLIANGIRNRFMAVRHSSLSAELRTEMLASKDWRKLGRVGSALRPPADIEEKARRIYERGLHGSIFGGNEPQHVMDALTGLNDVQVNALRKAYHDLFHIELEADLQREFRGYLGTSLGEERGELHQAQALLASAEARTDEERNEAAAQAAAAQIYAAGEGQVGTKEETIFRVLRGLSEDARRRVERIYRERYGRPLEEALRSELYDWATATTHDVDRAEALRVGNRELADAIAMDQALYYDFGSADREDVEAIYTTVRNDVIQEARRDGRNSSWVRMEIRRRMGRMETLYNERFEGEIVPGRETPHGRRGYGEQPYEPYRRGNLRENLGRIFPGAEGEGLVSLVEGDQLAADAARIRAERESAYVSDEAVNNVLAAQHDRAREEEELDTGRALRHLETRRMQNEEEDDFRRTGRFWTPEYRWERQEQLELNVERAIDRRAETRAGESMGRLAREYEWQSGGEPLQTVVSRYMSGSDRTAAQHMLDRGFLTPYERLRYAIEGAGTKEDLVKNALRGRTRAEIEDLDRLWRLDHNGETLRQALSGDLSGDDWIEAQIAYEGRPMTLDQAIAIARLREELTRPREFSTQTGMALGAVRDLKNLRNQLRDPRTAMLPPEEQQAYVDLFNGQRQVVDTVIETRNSIASEMTDAVINAVSIAAAVIVGAVGSIFTGGLAGAVALAIIASLVATASSITIRAVVLRNRYGLEQFGVEVAVGAVDAIVAALTAGMGSRLLGVRQVAAMAAQKTAAAGGQAARRTILASLRQALGRQIGPIAERTRAIAFLERMAAEEAAWYSRLTANAVSQTIENTIQSIPSAVVANALNEDNYRDGHGFLNILQGVGTQVATGVAQGLAFSAGQHIVSTGARSAWRFVRGPELGTITYRRGPAQMTAAEFEAHYRDFEQAHPGATRERFRDVLEQEHARVRERSEAQMEQRRQVRDEMNEALRESSDPEISALAGRLDDVPITRLSAAEYARVAGIGAPDIVIIERGGQVHIVMREGASPAAIREHAAALAARVEPGTGGRVRNLADVLPRDLREAVRIEALEAGAGLRPREVRVYPFPDVHIVAGPGATAADIRLHLRVARALVRLKGAHGRVLQMLEQARLWRLKYGVPFPGSRAYEAHFEIQKLPDIIRARQIGLSDPDLTPRQRRQAEMDVSALINQLEGHRRTLSVFDLRPGRGFIAAEGAPGFARAPELSPEVIELRMERFSRVADVIRAAPPDIQRWVLGFPEQAASYADSPHAMQRYIDALMQIPSVYRDIHVHLGGMLGPDILVERLTSPEGSARVRALVEDLAGKQREMIGKEIEAFEQAISALDPEAAAFTQSVARAREQLRQALVEAVALAPTPGTPRAREFFHDLYGRHAGLINDQEGLALFVEALKRQRELGTVHFELHAGSAEFARLAAVLADPGFIEFLASRPRRLGSLITSDFIDRLQRNAEAFTALGLAGEETVRLRTGMLEPAVLDVARRNSATLENILGGPDSPLRQAVREKLAGGRLGDQNFAAGVRDLFRRYGVEGNIDVLRNRITAAQNTGDLALLNRAIMEAISELEPGRGLPLEVLRESQDAAVGINRLFGISIHAGEQVPTTRLDSLLDDIDTAVMGGADRIGHGLALMLDLKDPPPSTHVNRRLLDSLGFHYDEVSGEWVRGRERYTLDALDRLRERQGDILLEMQRRGVTLEMNPSSNRVLSGFDPETYPVRHLLDTAPGLRVALGSDDPGILLTHPRIELAHLMAGGRVLWPEAASILLESFASRIGSAPLPDRTAVRDQLLADLVRGTPARERYAVLARLTARYGALSALPADKTALIVDEQMFRGLLRPFVDRAVDGRSRRPHE